MTKGQTVISIKGGIAKFIGFVCGYLFSSEVISSLAWSANYAKGQMPTLFDVFARWNSTVAVILMALLLIFLVKIIVKFELLNVITWLLLGALCGIVLPLIIPYISDRLDAHGYNLPYFLGGLIYER